jgi:hypothetical protein
MKRGSTFVISLPAIGAVRNMARPETNTVSPIMRAS